MARGSIIVPTAEEDFARLPELAGRSEADTGWFEWTEPDATAEGDFARASGVSVDVSGKRHKIVWDFTPLPEPETGPTYEELAEALLEVGIDVTRRDVLEQAREIGARVVEAERVLEAGRTPELEIGGENGVKEGKGG